LAGKVSAEGLIEAEAAGDGGGDADGADGSAFLQVDAVEGGEGSQIAFVLEGEFDSGDLGGIAMAEIGDAAFFTLPSWRKDSRT
jgi:hypothetical protein